MGVVSLPVVVWAAHFATIYGFTAFACARDLAAFIPWVIGGASALAVVALLALAVPAAARVGWSSRFTDFLVLGLAGLAGLGVAWETASVFWLAPCG